MGDAVQPYAIGNQVAIVGTLRPQKKITDAGVMH
jgi:hypothetical protein